MVNTIAVSDQSISDATEIEQAIPVGIIACHTRDFEAEHNTDTAQSHLRGHAAESGAFGESGSGYA